MEKKLEEPELICEYCGVGINIDNVKCPHCGANCTKTINKYKKQYAAFKKQEEEKKTASINETQGKVVSMFGKSFNIFIIGFVAVFIIFIISFIFINPFGMKSFDNVLSNTSNEEELNKSAEVGYNELAKTSKYEVILDSYELYEYKSEDFPDVYDTKSGYQKIAFHFIIENKSASTLMINNYTSVSLKADDYVVSDATLDVCVFCYTVSGKDEYPKLDSTLSKDEKVQGYVGFSVPKDKKELKFKVFDNITIVMDNPVYEGE